MIRPWARLVGSQWRRAIRLLGLLAMLALVVKFLGPRALVAYDLYRARSAFAEVNLAEAVSWLHAAELRQPDRADVQFLLGTAYRRNKFFRPASKHLKRAAALGYSPREVVRQEWMLLFQMGHIAEMEPVLRRLMDRGGSDELAEELHEAMMLGYLFDHRAREAKICSDHWIAWRPDSVRARLMRIYMYEALIQNPEKLPGELREVLRIDPGRVTQRLKLAELLLEQKQVEEALAECEICHKQAPHDPRVSLRLGACHFQLGMLDETKRELESALATGELEPTARLEALTLLAQIASGDHDFESAGRYCKEALDLRPYDSAAAYGLGMALSRMGKDELAQPYLKRSQRLGEQDQRLIEINRELVHDVDNLPLRLEAARIYVDQGRQAEAAGWMQSVLQRDPNLREANELLAEFFDKHGKSDLAQMHRDAAAASGATESPQAKPAQR